ncbi:hypothetical protein EGT36_21375 [Agrobacterium sp. FDAARGOS_525]|uniref:hypothetical protein n=1 Tax=Agrobacterium sp. FDAARGOS_525 TaxID=2420311 RepID=UPI000F6822E5|nr:hypothetical protein [Agrobacterium sp. FDAARGOS_525]RSC31227.1 hypothetical protein EGT36_21375 [Agrobacterium sp. FDAARGOS_525]
MENKPRHSHAEMVDGLEKMITAKAGWIETFSTGPKKRPDHEIEIQQKHLSVLRQAVEDYRRAANRPR